ncbi:uncharacterized protein [Solanum tuberosum]|uniref:NHL repeat-containing protein n=1 Tax=Solanum tuberosum TaxID=4113 RepID=M0ZY70_SOLTU|nr:PREDICTED: uncharacterized protein LOC102586185 isoform X2 [Solanum tuberosum]
MAVKFSTLILIFVFLSAAFCSVSATPSPAKIVNGFVTNAVTKLMKWVWSLKASTKTVISGRPMMKFESGYSVETVFDGSKLGIEPYSVEIMSSGELLILDSANSNLYKISSSLSQYTRPRLVAGSADGYSGHVDGKLREARMNHPKGLTVDDRGNIYVADTDNMVIRKISDAGTMTTIAGGKWSRGGGHVDGPSEDAKFSNDFDVVFMGSSCSLLVIDRGNKAIREIQLHFEDCAYQYDSGFPLGIAVLLAAGFFGYMLALLQRRVGTMVSPEEVSMKNAYIFTDHYEKPVKSSVRPPLIPTEGEVEKQEEGMLGSLGNLITRTGASVSEILGGVFPMFKRLPLNHHYQQQQQYQQQQYQQQQYQQHTWPVQDSVVVPKEDEPPSIESRTPTPRKTYAFMSKDSEKMQQLKQSRAFYGGGWNSDFQQHQQQTQKHLQHHQYHSSGPQTFYEQSSDNTKEVVFGAIQEQGQLEAMIIKPLDHANCIYDRHNARSRFNSAGYSQGY